ncbi:IS5 family transposase [uncultured Parasphingopyxis sp.]|uniref:IS5 family transposase n=1 Tax=uncultured Parasphingopyxis sp. TaxID=1547918 RepID=UPI00261C453C|nr:IS5 family transposase [uncultured Parasphingopyxis sp.]
MDGEVVRDDQWGRLREFVPGGRKGKRGPRSDGRRFFDALLWLARPCARWRDLPEDRFGPYQTIKRRYYRWIEAGVFDRIFEAVANDPDMEWLAIDATVIRAQAQAAGARGKKGGAQAQALGRSRGGFGTKIHAVVDALGLPVRFALGPGQQNDIVPACNLIRGLSARQVLADRACDANSLHDIILEQGGDPVIPPRRNRNYQHRYDHIAYKQRWGIEAFFAKLKQRRRIATRYDKLAANFLGFIKLASIMLWIK